MKILVSHDSTKNIPLRRTEEIFFKNYSTFNMSISITVWFLSLVLF